MSFSSLRFEATMNKLAYYLRQPSTRVGITILCGLTGVILPPGAIDLVLGAVVGGIGLYETFRDENKTPKTGA